MKLKNILLLIVIGSSSVFATNEKVITAIPVNDFLNSIGVNSAIYSRDENVDNTIKACQYLGVRWIRLDNADKPDSIKKLYEKSGIKVSCSLGSLNPKADFDLAGFISSVKLVAKTGALLAIEGCNEPNNWTVKYDNQVGGGRDSWIPVAKLQRDLYAAVKRDETLKKYPVWSTTETGAQTDNCGLQYLEIPVGANTLMPTGTKYADVACCHNYFVHPEFKPIQNNQTWIASDPTRVCKVDGLYANYGKTWGKHFTGYNEMELQSLPRVTTETGSTISGPITEEIQGLMYLSTFLAQYKHGWNYTAMYILRDRTDEDACMTYGIFGPYYKRRLAAVYLHNFTTILADEKSKKQLGKLAYNIPSQPETVHDLLLQKSNSKFYLVVWGERFAGGTDQIKVNFGKSMKSIKIYNPVIGTKTLKTLSKKNAINLEMTNHPYVLEIVK